MHKFYTGCFFGSPRVKHKNKKLFTGITQKITGLELVEIGISEHRVRLIAAFWWIVPREICPIKKENKTGMLLSYLTTIPQAS